MYFVIGKTLAQFKIIELLGKGGMGEVFRAFDQRLDRDVALKIISRSGSRSSQNARRFEREAKVLASLEHPNIASIYGFYVDSGIEFIAMELISGDTLEGKIISNGMTLHGLLEIGIPLAGAIAFAHDRGVVHRDLKPANIMCDLSGRIQVLDFGLAVRQESPPLGDPDATEDFQTSTGEILGTVHYMAPEQLEGCEVDARADVFSLGIILYELATGGRPFQADSNLGVASAILRDAPVAMGDLRPDLPRDLARVIRRCLAKKVDDRMQTARDVFNELKDIKTGIRTEGLIASSARPENFESIDEHGMVITIKHVRELTTRIPRMVGESMTYLDNGRHSDVLLICLHGIGGDQNEFEDVLRISPYRTIALSLFGFGSKARFRPALSYDDQNKLVGFLIEEICKKVTPAKLILAGHSSGADQIMQVMSSSVGKRLHPHAVVLLGPSVIAGAGLMSGPYSGMVDDKEKVFTTLRTMSGYTDNLHDWLILHEYLLSSFRKFGKDTAALQVFAKTYIESEDEDSFFRMFRAAVEHTSHLRCVFGPDDNVDLDHALSCHINDNWLGDAYQEKMIVKVPDGHIGLKSASVLLPVVDEVLQAR